MKMNWPYICAGTAVTAFILGLFTGMLCTKDGLEAKYRVETDKEIQSVKEAFTKRLDDIQADEKKPVPRSELRETTRRYQGERAEEESGPVVIPPEEYGETDGFLLCELTAYADGVVTDEMGDPVDIADTIGEDALHRFGEYEEDAVYVRNDSRMCDYAVYRDLRTFADVKKTMPPDIRELDDFPSDGEDDETG